MLKIAENYYQEPGLAEKVLLNAPQTNIRDTETELLSALESGQIDYLAIYKSDAKQHGLNYLELPPQIDLSNPVCADIYHTAKVQTKNGELFGKPIIYAVTIPDNAPEAEWARKYVAFLLGEDGQNSWQKKII